jgi:hypothetical protein
MIGTGISVLTFGMAGGSDVGGHVGPSRSIETIAPLSYNSLKYAYPLKLTNPCPIFYLFDETDNSISTLLEWGTICTHSLTVGEGKGSETSPFIFEPDKNFGTSREKRVEVQMVMELEEAGRAMSIIPKNKGIVCGGAGNFGVQCISFQTLRSVVNI